MTTVELAPGAGWLACRSGALLWSPDASRPDAVLDAFLGAPDAESTHAAVTAAVVGAALDVPAFALVTWPRALHVVVMGAVDVETDAPSLPLLSGATSRTWVEHGVPGEDVVVVCAGTAPAGGTDVGSGVVRAGGFRLTAQPGGAGEHLATAVPAAPVPPCTGTTPAPQPAPAPSSGAALLDLVTGGDWMDDSIGLGAPGALLEVGPDPEPSEPVPVFEEGTVTVPGRFCPAGHANSPTQASCRRCGDLIDLTAPVTEVAQPLLAELVGDDGETIPIVGAIVVGRRPDPGAAGVEDDAGRLVLPERPGVSADAPRRPCRRVDDHRHRLRVASRNRARPARRRAGSTGAVDVARGAARRRPAPRRADDDPPGGAARGGLLPVAAVTLHP